MGLKNLIKEAVADSNKVARTIGVAGSQNRIGTTTQSIQIVKYLKLMGYEVCYIELNENNYLKKLQEVYETIPVDPKQGKMTLDDVDMFSINQLVTINKIGYDFCVKDYGSANSQGFESTSFIEQDFRILVCGTKPNEIFHTQEILRKYSETHYIFNFVPKSDRDAIKGMMLANDKNTFFADYVSDPYVYLSSANSTYKKIFGL